MTVKPVALTASRADKELVVWEHSPDS